MSVLLGDAAGATALFMRSAKRPVTDDEFKEASERIQAQLRRRVRAWRESKDLSQDQLAKAMGLASVSVAGVENGVRRVTNDYLVRAAMVFGVSFQYLVSNDPDEPAEKG